MLMRSTDRNETFPGETTLWGVTIIALNIKLERHGQILYSR